MWSTGDAFGPMVVLIPVCEQNISSTFPWLGWYVAMASLRVLFQCESHEIQLASAVV